jgi:opacity protein-like surface antigen
LTKARCFKRHLVAHAIVGASLASVPVFAEGPDGFFVNAAAGAGRPLAVGENKFGLVSSVSGGFRFDNGLRPELELSYRPNNKDGVSERAAGLMGNLWYELWEDGYYFYLGGGFGAVRLKVSADAISASDTQAAWQAGLGFGHSLTRQLSLGLDYRHLATFDKPHFTVQGVSAEAAHYMTGAVMIELRYSFGQSGAADPVPAANAPVRVQPLQP